MCEGQIESKAWNIKCSAAYCPIVWFHDECTKLLDKPKFEAWYCPLCRRENSTQKKRIPELLKAYEQYKQKHLEQEVISEKLDLNNADHDVALTVDKQRDNNEVGGICPGNKSIKVDNIIPNNEDTMPRWVELLCEKLNRDTTEIIRREIRIVEQAIETRVTKIEN